MRVRACGIRWTLHLLVKAIVKVTFYNLQLLLHFRTTQSFGRVSTLWVGGFDCHVLLLQFMIVELCNWLILDVR